MNQTEVAEILTGRYCDWRLIAFGAAMGATAGGVIGLIRLRRRESKGETRLGKSATLRGSDVEAA